MSYLLDTADVYASCGLSVIPWGYVQRDGGWDKVPMRTWRVREVPRMTRAEIQAHWAQNPEHNVGVITGFVSGIVVVDCDTPEALAWAQANLPPTPWQIATGREGGGRHLGYKYPKTFEGSWLSGPAKIGCKHKKIKDKEDPRHKTDCLAGGALCGLDLRADGGYVAMPPSVHKSGLEYEWLGEVDDLVQDVLLKMPVFDPAWLPGIGVQLLDVDLNPECDWETESLGGNVEAARRWVLEQPGAVSGGGGRNQTFQVAAALTRDFALTFKQAWPIFKEYNARCKPPWDDKPLRGKLEDGFLKGTSMIGCRNTLDLSNMLEPATPPQATTQVEIPDVVVLDKSPLDPATMDDETFSRWLPAEAAVDNGAPFLDKNLSVAARLHMHNKAAYARLEKNIKDSGFKQLVAWRNAVRAVIRTIRGEKFRQTSTDERPTIAIGMDDKALRDTILQTLRNCPGIFVAAERLAFVSQEASMKPLNSGTMRNVVVDNCALVSTTEDGESRPATLPAPLLAMLENLMPDQLGQFRHVAQVTKSPFFTPNGTLVSTSGYNEETRTLLVDSPGVNTDIFPTVQDALDSIAGVFSDFHFQSRAEYANYLGALLTPMIRPSYDGPTPFLIIEANMPKAGKTLLADCIQLLYGYRSGGHSLPQKEEELEKRMLALLGEGKSVLTFDNVRYSLDSPVLESIATCSGQWTCRILGTNESRSVDVRQLIVVTANNLQMTADAARRQVRVRLLARKAGETVKDQKKYAIADLRAFIPEFRSWLLSALAKIAQAWFAAGKPVPDTVPLLPSFEVFCHTVGGILHHAGVTEWLTNAEESRRAFSLNEEWTPFFNVWHKTFESRPQTAPALFQLAMSNGLLLSLVARAPDPQAKQSFFSRRLNDMRDYSDDIWTIRVQTDKNGSATYTLSPTVFGEDEMP